MPLVFASSTATRRRSAPRTTASASIRRNRARPCPPPQGRGKDHQADIGIFGTGIAKGHLGPAQQYLPRRVKYPQTQQAGRIQTRRRAGQEISRLRPINRQAGFSAT